MNRRDLPLRDQVTLLELALHETETSLASARTEARAAQQELDDAWAAVGEAWKDGNALCEAIEAKCSMSHGPEAG